MKKVLLSAIFLMASVSAMAQSTSSNGGPGDGKGPGKNPAVEAAIKECASSVAKDSNGRPDHSAMEACMTAKGFTPPPHGPRGGEKGGRSQSNSTGTTSDALK